MIRDGKAPQLTVPAGSLGDEIQLESPGLLPGDLQCVCCGMKQVDKSSRLKNGVI